MSEFDVVAWKESCAALRQKIGRYDRKDLPKLSPCFYHPGELLEPTAHFLVDRQQAIENTQRLIDLLEKACRMERERGLKGHWTYCVPRHAALRHALDMERVILDWLLAEATPKYAKTLDGYRHSAGERR